MTDNIRVVRLTHDYQFKSFDCGNQDLNDFLLSDSKPYLQKLLSVTYILETSFVTVDALREAIPFYLKNDFRYLDKTTADADTDTCLMYYDLTKLVD